MSMTSGGIVPQAHPGTGNFKLPVVSSITTLAECFVYDGPGWLHLLPLPMKNEQRSQGAIVPIQLLNSQLVETMR